MITQVDPYVFRSPRPQPRDFPFIRSTFASVFSLEGLAEDHKEEAELSPVPVISQPIGFWQIYLTGDVPLASILHFINLAPKPTLVHCQHGQDRTGLVIAAYRVRVMGWTKDSAMAEARDFGYRWWLNFGLNRTWRDFEW